MQDFSTCLWFVDQAEQAARHYVAVFAGSRITSVSRVGEGGPGEPGSVLTVAFELQGRPFVALNGGPRSGFTPAISFVVTCADQDEVDYYWDHLVDGGQESQCGWLTDRFGVSWQVVPQALPDLLGDPDPGRAARAMTAMLAMRRIDIAALQRAADAAPSG